MRRLDIGIASYGSPDKLDTTLSLLRAHCRTDWRCFVILNPHPDPNVDHEVNRVVQLQDDPRIRPVDMATNVQYSGAVNELFRRAETEYIAYCDNDAHVQTPGWDEAMAGLLDRHHELGIVFPAGGAYPIDRGNYHEILWGIGCLWMTTRVAAEDAKQHPSYLLHDPPCQEYFDTRIGHQNEVDFATRLRLQGYRIASCPDVHVVHHASASSDPAAQERISRGVVQWVDKWCRFFCGKGVTYHSPNVLRHEDWPPSAIYLEEYWKLRGIGELNAAPSEVNLDGTAYDLIRVPRLRGFYRHRVI